MIRDDLSANLIHLTRGVTDQDAANAFLSIVKDRKLRGGCGCIKGGFNCVCFSEAPVGKLAQILANPSAHGVRYRPFGVMVDKPWLFLKGGRPVIYQTDAEYVLLHENQKFRHVRYEPPRIDFTWEREWRFAGDELDLDPHHSTLVVPTRAWEKWFQDQHVAMLGRRALLTGFIGPRAVSDYQWHFIVLRDLGVDVPSVDPPAST